MGRRRSLYVKALLCWFLATAVVPVVEAGSSNRFGIDIDNFGQINQNYYRGGQPDLAGFVELKKLGIKTVIDLQGHGRGAEPGWVHSLGMQYFQIPLSVIHPATASESAYFLELVNDSRNWPVFVHCAEGRHRTGEMTAIYRITHDAWTADRAYQEMRQYKFYAFPLQGSLKQYVYDYYSEYQRQSAQAPAN